MILNYLLQHIDWIAGPFGLVGMYLLAYKNKWGWIGLLLCSIGFGIIGFIHNLHGLIITSAIYALIEIRGFVKYDKDHKIERNVEASNPLSLSDYKTCHKCNDLLLSSLICIHCGFNNQQILNLTSKDEWDCDNIGHYFHKGICVACGEKCKHIKSTHIFYGEDICDDCGISFHNPSCTTCGYKRKE